MSFNRESEFEEALIEMLSHKGWEKEVLYHPTEQELIDNWAKILYDNNNIIDRLNDAPLTDTEMQQLIDKISELRKPVNLNRFINDKTVSIKRDNPADALHFGKEITLKIFDPHEIAAGQSRYQIARQPHFHARKDIFPERRGDVMLLINGMPVIHLELKKSGVGLSQAYNQIEKYSREGIFRGLFSLVQIFVAMTPDNTVYFANPGEGGKFNQDFYFHWADWNNKPQNDWKYIATYLLSIPMAHQLIGYYTIADSSDGILKVLRSYQYEAVRAIHDKVAKCKDWTGEAHQLGGYIWHTTGSGKTMSSFKAAELIVESGSADKVVFVIDRIELGTQSLNEYRNFSGNRIDVQETNSTKELIGKLKSPDIGDMLIVTSIQKLGVMAEGSIMEVDLERINKKRIVFIVDECHRSTFGDSFINIKQTFPTAMFFGFTGTPIKVEKMRQGCTTVDVFGDELHRYTISDGIRDGNVLGFDPYKVMTFKDTRVREVVALDKVRAATVAEAMADEKKRKIFLDWMNHPMAGKYNEDGTYLPGVEDELPNSQYETDEHCMAVVKDIVEGWDILSKGNLFHAILATTSIPQAIHYYKLFKESAPQLHVTALFDPSLPNDNPDNVIVKEEALAEILKDYSERYRQNFSISTHALFKKDVSNRLAHKGNYKSLQADQRLDLLIVVSQMLTGFDSKWLNTLYLDKVLEYSDLIQAFSRTNRLYNEREKPFGTIKYYQRPHTMERNIEEAVKAYSGTDPIQLFVSKLDINIEGMNGKFMEIVQLFESVSIKNFAHLPKENAMRGRFAALFRAYNRYLEAARVQGFRWDKRIYNKVSGSGEIEINHDEHQYNTLLQRYKELFKQSEEHGNVRGEDLPYELDSYLTEIDTGKIDNDYMNRNFERYVKALDQTNVSKEELAQLLDELSTSFASLPQEEQKYAEIFLHDVQSKNIVLESGKTFRDYITDYVSGEKNRIINELGRQFGLDKDLLKTMLNQDVTEKNIDDFGRFSSLVSSVDRQKARQFFDKKMKTSISMFRLNIEIDRLLRAFILTGKIEI